MGAVAKFYSDPGSPWDLWFLVNIFAVVLPAAALWWGRRRDVTLLRAVSIPLAVLGLGWATVRGPLIIVLLWGWPYSPLVGLVLLWGVAFAFKGAAMPPPEGAGTARAIYVGTGVLVAGLLAVQLSVPLLLEAAPTLLAGRDQGDPCGELEEFVCRTVPSRCERLRAHPQSGQPDWCITQLQRPDELESALGLSEPTP